MKTTPPQSLKAAVAKGVALLPSVESITITLDNGDSCVINRDAELAIPDDLDDADEAARKAPGRLAFLDGQAERALYAVRVYETRLRELEGVANKQVRLMVEARRDGEMVAESAVQAGVDCRKDVVAARLHLNRLRLNYGLLRSLRDAASHRVWTLNRLLDKAAKSHSAPSGHYDE